MFLLSSGIERPVSFFLSFLMSLCFYHRSEWSPCTASCGNGIKARTRLYINPEAQGMCDMELIQKAACFGDRPECNPNFFNTSSRSENTGVGGFPSAFDASETKGKDEPLQIHSLSGGSNSTK